MGRSAALRETSPRRSLVAGYLRLGEVSALEPDQERLFCEKFGKYLDRRFSAGRTPMTYFPAPASDAVLSTSSTAPLVTVYPRLSFLSFSLPDGSIRLFSGIPAILSEDEQLYLLGFHMAMKQLGYNGKMLAEALRQTQKAARAEVLSEDDFAAVLSALLSIRLSLADALRADEFARAFLEEYGKNSDTGDTVLRKFTLLTPNNRAISSLPPPVYMLAAVHKSRAAKLEKNKKLRRSVKKDRIKLPPEAPPATRSNLENSERNKTIEKATQPESRPLANAVEPISPGWYIQLASETASDTALDKASLLKTLGARGITQKVVFRGVTFYRILVGPYRTRDLAAADITRVQECKLSSGTPFLREEK